MSLAQELTSLLVSYLSGHSDLETIDNWLADCAREVDATSDPVARTLAGEASILLAEFDRRDRDENSVRQELRALLERQTGILAFDSPMGTTSSFATVAVEPTWQAASVRPGFWVAQWTSSQQSLTDLLKQEILAVVDHRRTLDDLRAWLADHAQKIVDAADPAADALDGHAWILLSEYDLGDRSEAEVRAELERLVTATHMSFDLTTGSPSRPRWDTVGNNFVILDVPAGMTIMDGQVVLTWEAGRLPEAASA